MDVADRILVIEDNPDNQLLASAVLERDGFLVDVAESAEAALRTIGLRRPNLILMDIQLAGEDGLSLTRQLKDDASTASIPVVALSAHAMVGDRQAALSAGCSGYITKPIDTRHFVDQVKAFLVQPSEVASSDHHIQERNGA